MDKIKSNFEILANNLAAECNSKHSPELYKALLSTRDVIDSLEFNSKSPRFREFLADHFTIQLSQALSASNNKLIVDNIVTVLGDICTHYNMDEDATFFVLIYLNSKLSMLSLEDDSIIGRIYRFLGNVYQKRYLRSENSLEEGEKIIKHIVCTLKAVTSGTSDVTSEATIIMGIRCIRQFLNSSTLIVLVPEFDVLKPLGLMLIKYSKTWNQNHEHKNILYNVIKFLYDYSKFDCHDLLTELKNIEQGNSLLCLSDVLLVSPKHTVKIVMNILRMTWLKSQLPIPEICEELVEFLTNGTFMLETEYEEYFQCICCLFEHPANRNGNDWVRNIPFLINTLKHFREVSDSNLKCSFLIISTVYKYIEYIVIQEQLDNGLIEVLTEKLEWILSSSDSFNLEHEFQSRKQNDDVLMMEQLRLTNPPLFWSYRPGDPLAPSKPNNINYMFPYNIINETRCNRTLREAFQHGINLDHRHYYNSLLDCTCSNSSTPSSSSGSSGHPKSTVLKLCDFSPNYDYFLNSSNNKEMTIDSNFKRCNGEVSYKLFACSEQKTKLSLLLEEIIHLIRNCRDLIEEHPRLASSDLLIALLKCYYFNRSIMSLEMICEILYTSSYLILLISNDFVPKLLELTRCQHSDNCSKCDQLRKMRNTILTNLTIYAESSVGVRDIEFKLLRANEDVKVKLTLAIPYIIESKSLLVKFMIDCRGLEILLEICQNELKSRGIKVLCKLAAKKLAIANPKKFCQEPTRHIVIYTDKYRSGRQSTNVVTFKLDDGSSVLADREFLSLKSDYFNTLLNGSFREGKEDEIRLSDISNRTLNILLYLLDYHFDNAVGETLLTNLDLETLLEVTRQCDKFLLNNVCVVLTTCIVGLKLSPETVSRIYQWSVESCTNLLRAEVVAFALVVNVADEQRFTMFNNLFSLGYSEVLVEDIRKLMEGYLKSELRVVHSSERSKNCKKMLEETMKRI